MSDDIVSGGVLTATIIILVFAGVLLALLLLEAVPLLRSRFRHLRHLSEEKKRQDELSDERQSDSVKKTKEEGEVKVVVVDEERESDDKNSNESSSKELQKPPNPIIEDGL